MKSFVRSLSAVACLMLVLAAHATPAHAKRPPRGGGGGGSTCPTNRLAFAPTTAAELQSALDCADPGAIITLASGLTYEGNFTLRQKPVVLDGTTPRVVTIQSDAVANLPADTRVGPDDIGSMAWLKVPSGSSNPVLVTELNGTTNLAASHYRLIGIRFFTDHWVSQLVRLGTGTERATSQLPTDIAFDRSVFAGSPGQGTKQGLVANGVDVAVTNSSFTDFKDTSNDALAIIIWNGAGPLLVENNYMEGSGENFMAGGGDPTISNLVPSDITFRWNHLVKPLVWTTETSTQNGGKWRIKNLFELKNARRVLVHGNVLENNWIQADQLGFAVQFTPRNQSGGCTWCTVEDVTFEYNVVKNSIAGFNLLVTDDLRNSKQLHNISISNNLLININANAVPGTSPGDRAGRLMQILNPSPATTGAVNLTVDHNTAISGREISFSLWGAASGVTVTNNVIRHNPCSTSSNDCGMSGNGTAPGMPSLTTWFGAPLTVTANTFFASGKYGVSDYPAGNDFPTAVTFRSDYLAGTVTIDQTTGLATGAIEPDYTVVSTTGTPSGRGADWNSVKAETAIAVSGVQP